MSGFCQCCGKDTTQGDEGLCLCGGCASKRKESASSASPNTQSTATKLAQIATRLEQRVATDGLMTLEDRWQTVVMDAVHQLRAL